MVERANKEANRHIRLIVRYRSFQKFVMLIMYDGTRAKQFG